MLIVMKYSFLIKYLKLECDIDEYLYFSCVGTLHTKVNGKRVLERYFNATVRMEFKVGFTFTKYENDMLSLCEATNVFSDAFL